MTQLIVTINDAGDAELRMEGGCMDDLIRGIAVLMTKEERVKEFIHRTSALHCLIERVMQHER